MDLRQTIESAGRPDYGGKSEIPDCGRSSSKPPGTVLEKRGGIPKKKRNRQEEISVGGGLKKE